MRALTDVEVEELQAAIAVVTEALANLPVEVKVAVSGKNTLEWRREEDFLGEVVSRALPGRLRGATRTRIDRLENVPDYQPPLGRVLCGRGGE
jgi:hypothetical protein